ncbi:MAG: EAL domain-containing protein [Siculibacillus sp.]
MRVLRAIAGLRSIDRTIDEETARFIRGDQVAAIVELSPMSAAANVFNAVLIAFAFHDHANPIFLAAWVGALTVFSFMAMRNWSRSRRRTITTASPRALNRAAINAVTLASVWGIAPLILTPGADAYHQLAMQVMMTGMAAGGAFGLATVPRAAIPYVWIMVLSAMASMIIGGKQELATDTVALMLWSAYGLYLTRNIAVHSSRFFENSRNRAELTEKTAVIGLLLNDFQEHGSDWLWETDATGRIVDPSRRFAEAAGRTSEEMSGLPLRALLASSASDPVEPLFDAMQWYETFLDRVVELEVGGQRRSWSMTGRPVFRSNGVFCGYHGVASDVTERREAEARVAWLAATDPVTGLANRAKFSTELERAMAAEETFGRLTLYCVDLDRFKAVNDTMGHPVGDVLLAEVGRRLIECSGAEFLVARIGGDEFALLHPGCDRPDRAADIAMRILATFDTPFTLDGADFSIGASIGIAIGPDDGATPAELMKSADLALYRAKEEGRDTFRFFEAGMDARARRRRQLEQGLRAALDTDQLRLVYQPIVDVGDYRVSGFETLVRWRSPEFGNVSPGEFIPIAEDCKLIVPMGEWILRSAIAEAARWPRHLKVSINLSPIQLRHRRLLAVIVDALDASGMPPTRLQVEITETTLLEAAEETLRTLQDLRALGVRVALDDFGTGYSSLNYLRKFPLDKIKIDKSFVDDIDGNTQSRAIVKAIMDLTGALGMTTVAEGVETLSQMSELRALGCHEIQGYAISAAIEAEAVADFLGRNLRRVTGEIVESDELVPTDPPQRDAVA